MPKRDADVNFKKPVTDGFMQDSPQSRNGALYIVATPIGNLEDITLRALRILKEVDLIAAEDTRHTRKLLSACSISTRLISLHEHNEKKKSAFLIAQLARGLNVAYVSDAGTPGIADPGQSLVEAAHIAGIRVVPVPGPCAAVAALGVAGFISDHFLFYGFLPARPAAKTREIENLKACRQTLIFYEAPGRFGDTLARMKQILGDREIVVGREMTKMHEEIRRGRISEFLEGRLLGAEKGEFVIVVRAEESPERVASDEDIEESLKLLFASENCSVRDAADRVSLQTGASRKKVYGLAVKLRA